MHEAFRRGFLTSALSECGVPGRGEMLYKTLAHLQVLVELVVRIAPRPPRRIPDASSRPAGLRGASTSVKCQKQFSGDLNIADMVTINANFDSRTSDYHALQERLSSGNTTQSFSTTTVLKPDNFFNKKLGFDPIRLTFSKSTQIPQFDLPPIIYIIYENN